MNLVLSGFSEALTLGSDRVSVLEVHNRRLFARICQSLASELDSEALEPYALWNGEDQRSSRNYFLFVFNPFELPWSERALMGEVLERVEVDPFDALLDNLIKFLKFASDAAFEKQLVFVNLKNFLEPDEVQEFYRQAVFLELNVLLLENVPDDAVFEYERKMCIDKDFLQS